MKVLDQHVAESFTAIHGDNTEVVPSIPDNTIDLTVTSPPFPAMYAYSNSPRDIGNTSGIGEMLEHFAYLVRDLLRATKLGRSCCIHLTNVPAFKHHDGYVGRFDFRGDVIRLFQREGWIYSAEVTIDKCPQVRAQRTKDRGLLFKSLATDASLMSPVMPDYLLVFRKPGDNREPIRAGMSDKYGSGGGWFTQDQWIVAAQAIWGFSRLDVDDLGLAYDTMSGCWYRKSPDNPDGIKETDVLNVAAARDSEDERHLCPLQLGVIRNCVRLWSAPGEVVLDPFGGIGSTAHEAIKLNRKGLIIELKESYYRQSIRNCERAAASTGRQRTIFDTIDFNEEAA